MFEIGIAGLDTSHPAAFADILSQREDVTIGAVWDDGTVRADEYVDSFCEQYDAELYDDISEMTNAVDGVMILTVDWERHVPLATTFLDAGVPTLVDKPLAGDFAALEALEAASRKTPLCGGSAVPFHPELAALSTEAGNRTIFAAGYNDFFYYRVHISDVIRRIADAPWTLVEPTDYPGTTLRARFENGTDSIVRYDGAESDGTFGILDVTDHETRSVEIQSGEDSFSPLYQRYLDRFIRSIEGVYDDTDIVLDAGRFALAVEAALESGERITPEKLPGTEVSLCSAQFVDSYEPYY